MSNVKSMFMPEIDLCMSILRYYNLETTGFDSYLKKIKILIEKQFKILILCTPLYNVQSSGGN